MPDTATVTASAATVEPKATAPVLNGNGAAPTVTKPVEPTRAIKINGKEVQLTEAQIVALAQKGYFADQRNKSFDVLKSKTEGLINALKTPEGLLEVLKDPSLGNSPKEVFKKLMASDVIDDELKEEMSLWVYKNVVEQSKKTPEQIETEKKLSELDKLKKAENERQQKQLTEQQQQKVQEIYQAVRSEVVKQILADKTFPQTEGSIRSVIEKMRVMNKQGVPVTIENIGKALQLVKKDHIIHQQTILDAFEDPEALINAIGESRALKISRALVARLQNKSKVAAEAKPVAETEGKERTTDRIDKKLGRERHGFTILNV